MRRLMGAVVAASLLAFAATPAHVWAKGSDISPQDTAAIRGYVVTPDKFNKWATATAAIKRDEAKNPALKHAMEGKNGQQPQTIGETVALLKQHPEVAAYYHKVGLSDMDAVLMPIVAMTAGMATMVPPDKWKELPVTPAQITFMKAHMKELQALSKSSGDD